MSEPPDWFDWQQAHAEALKALQAAQHAYNRLTTEQAFAGSDGDAATARRAALEKVDAARRHLDEVRRRQPR